MTAMKERGCDGRGGEATGPYESIRQMLAETKGSLSVEELSQLLNQLQTYKRDAELAERDGSMEMLLHFLQESRDSRARQLEHIQKELSCLEQDIDRVEAVCSVKMSSSDLTKLKQCCPKEEGNAERIHPELLEDEQPLHRQHSQTAQVSGQNMDATREINCHAAVNKEEDERQLMQCIQHHVRACAPNASSSQVDSLIKHPGMATFMKTQCCGCRMGSQKASCAESMLSEGGAEDPMARGCRSSACTGVNRDCAAIDAMTLPSLPDLKKRRLESQFDDLRKTYLRLRMKKVCYGSEAQRGCNEALSCRSDGKSEIGRKDDNSQKVQDMCCQKQHKSSSDLKKASMAHENVVFSENDDSGVDDALEQFSQILSVLNHCNRLTVRAEIPRPSLRQSSSIISSIEFDKDGTLFASAGVSKRISIFERAAVMQAPSTSVHCPVMELVTRSKLSCLSWNRYIASQLTSSDYEGVVTLWDVNTSSMVQEWEAHARRIWSVDFCDADPMLIASGSDDCTVKVWSSQAPSSLAQIDLRANVTAVKWRPGSAYELAVGSADHSVYLYDLRHPAAPLAALPGHRKAVSYVRWFSSSDLVSASTDSTLRLWGCEPSGECMTSADDVALQLPCHPLRTYEGHLNEKNFVGLATQGDFLACGSENNETFVYHKQLSKPIARLGFHSSSSAAGDHGLMNDEVGRAFVSAVSWHPGGKELLTADSQGTIRLLELHGDSDE